MPKSNTTVFLYKHKYTAVNSKYRWGIVLRTENNNQRITEAGRILIFFKFANCKNVCFLIQSSSSPPNT